MYLGLDLGTSGVKALLIDGDQNVVGSANGALDVSRLHHGWSEQNPADWITATQTAIAGLKAKHAKELGAVKGIGLSGHMHGATLVDAAGDVLRPCILWNDTRSYAEAAKLDADPRFRKITGNIVFPGFTAPKLVWVANNEPEIFSKVAKVLLPKDYLRLWLTGEYLSEMSDSAGTSWLDTGARKWSTELLEATGLTENTCHRWSKVRMRREHCAQNLPPLGAFPARSWSPVVRVITRHLPAAWARCRKAMPSYRWAHQAFCLPPTPPICPSRKAPSTPSAMRCPTHGTRWASFSRRLTH